MHPPYPPFPYMPPYPIPYQMSGFPGNSRKRRHSPEMASSDDAEAGIEGIEYPNLFTWLQNQTDNLSRNRDKQDFVVYAQVLKDNGVTYLDDVTRFNRHDLCELAGMNKGTGARLLDWAVLDKAKLEKKHRGRKGGF
jgi:hypothetical protein